MTMEVADYWQAARTAAVLATQELAKWRKQFQVKEKGLFDLVTDADVASQKAIHGYLSYRFPDHAFLGEEGDADKSRPSADAPPTWIVDPIDGTTNYVHDCPLYAISIGLQIDGELVVGVVHDPSRNEMFHAAKDHGAFINEEAIRTSDTDTLARALVATGFPTDIRGKEFILDYWTQFSYKAQALRRTGSTAINLAYLAAGRFDGFYAFDNHVWDVAGGVAVLLEAGGSITNADGSAYDPYTVDCVASNGPLQSVMLEEIGKRKR